MRKHIAGIDHVVVVVKDLDQAARTWARLGFTLTPRGYHTMGSQNHCLMFARDYIELLAVPVAHPATRHFTDFLPAGEGLASFALATDDAQAAHDELAAAGYAPGVPIDFSRPVALPGGTRDAAFRIVHLPNEATPGSRTFLCQHFSRDVVWRDEYVHHPLGVTAIAGIAVRSAETDKTAQAYARFFASATEPIAEGLRVDTGSTPLALTDAARLGARLAGVKTTARAGTTLAVLYLRVADRAVAADVLRKGGFRPRRLADGAWAIGADVANGVALVFG